MTAAILTGIGLAACVVAIRKYRRDSAAVQARLRADEFWRADARTRGGYESSARPGADLAPPPKGAAPGWRRDR